MKKIMLVCSAGMSTSLLVTKMQKAAGELNVDVDIFACSEAEAKEKYEEVDILLLGPQVRFLLSKIEKLVKVPVEVIETMDYGTMNGKAVLEKALKLLNS